MLRILLCGASDTERIRTEFGEIVSQFGGEAWHYQSGHILHLNSARASWQQNSKVTVRNADLCIFVIVEKYGQLTWQTELREALVAGKPFLIFCLDATYQKYLTLSRAIADHSAIRDTGDRMLVETIREMESERESTIVPFTYGLFGQELRRQLAALFALSLWQLEERNQHAAVARLLGNPSTLTTADLVTATAIALDEADDKTVRKRAILALATRGGVDPETVLTLLSSAEQGVQRLVAQSLEGLYTTRPADSEFFEHCVSIANRSDDIGLARRLIRSLLDIDLGVAIPALALLDLSEIGSRRRLAEALERFEEAIRERGLSTDVLPILDKCLEDTGETGWKARCRDFRQRLVA